VQRWNSMNHVTPQSLKKLLIALGISIFVIIIFLVLKVFLYEEREIELKSFKHAQAPKHTTKTQVPQEDKQENLNTRENIEEKKLQLLPAK